MGQWICQRALFGLDRSAGGGGEELRFEVQQVRKLVNAGPLLSGAWVMDTECMEGGAEVSYERTPES